MFPKLDPRTFGLISTLSNKDVAFFAPALNRLLITPLPPNFGDSDEKENDGGSTGGTTGGGATTGFGGGGDEGGEDDDAIEPDENEPEEVEPDPDMI